MGSTMNLIKKVQREKKINQTKFTQDRHSELNYGPNIKYRDV